MRGSGTAKGEGVGANARGWIGFMLVLLVVNGGVALLATLISKDPLVVRAMTISAAVAAGSQLVGFAGAKYLLHRKLNLFAAWGAAMAVRFVSLAVYALLVFKTLGLVPAPALITFAGLLLLTSIAEPLFLNSDSNTP